MNKTTRTALRAASIAALTGLAMSAAHAVNWTGRVTMLSIDKDWAGNLVFIKLEGNKPGRPVCHSNLAWDFVLPIVDAADKNMYAMLLAANSSGQTVIVRGTDGCPGQFSSIEQAIGVRIVPAQ